LTNNVSEMLYLVGLGLADETDITVKGLQIVKQADRVYLEAYTSVLLVDKEKLVPSCSFLTT
jgi:diphthine methyl ester synthase